MAADLNLVSITLVRGVKWSPEVDLKKPEFAKVPRPSECLRNACGMLAEARERHYRNITRSITEVLQKYYKSSTAVLEILWHKVFHKIIFEIASPTQRSVGILAEYLLSSCGSSGKALATSCPFLDMLGPIRIHSKLNKHPQNWFTICIWAVGVLKEY